MENNSPLQLNASYRVGMDRTLTGFEALQATGCTPFFNRSKNKKSLSRTHQPNREAAELVIAVDATIIEVHKQCKVTIASG